MNKTKIEWADATWNPVTGCLHGCPYCYAARIAKRFSGGVDVAAMHGQPVELIVPQKKKNGNVNPYPFGFLPTLHRYRLDEPQKWKEPRTIFVCSMADLFGAWVPEWWIKDVMDAAMQAQQHRYLLLTKNPKKYVYLIDSKERMMPGGGGFWYGATVTNAEQAALAAVTFNEMELAYRTFASVEPLMADIVESGGWTYLRSAVDWVIIGAETGNRAGKIKPKKEWVDHIVADCDALNTPVFMKDSLIPIVGEANMRREFPW